MLDAPPVPLPPVALPALPLPALEPPVPVLVPAELLLVPAVGLLLVPAVGLLLVPAVGVLLVPAVPVLSVSPSSEPPQATNRPTSTRSRPNCSGFIESPFGGY